MAGVLHLCFELTQHGDSIAAILPGLSAALQQDPALCAPLLPSLALLAQLSPQSTADDIMAHILSLCSSLPSIPSSVRGVVPPSIYTAVCYSSPCMPLWKLQGLVLVIGRNRLLSFCDVSTMFARLQAIEKLTLGLQPLLFHLDVVCRPVADASPDICFLRVAMRRTASQTNAGLASGSCHNR